MKKFIKSVFFIGILSILCFFPKTALANASETQKIPFVLFHSETCPHCKEEIKFIDKILRPQYDAYVDFRLYEIGDQKNQVVYTQYARMYNVNLQGVPVTFVGNELVYGFGSAESTGEQIISLIEKKINESGVRGIMEQPAEKELVNIPVLGEINLASFSLPLLTVAIGLLDGFNPCAMWVLLFLISLLLGIEDRKRMWILGGLFILSSGIVYFFFMAAWLSFVMFVGMIFAIRVLIGLTAIGVGSWNLRDYWKNRKADGVVCKVSNKTGTKNTFEKIKEIVYKKSLLWSIFGIILLGFSVNLVELACSAGFPAVFTQVLAMSEIAQWKRYLYMAGYIFFYMLDDMVVFGIAMFTLKSKTIGGKYAKYANLIGGLIILILGLLLIFKPGWLNFG